MNGQWWIYIIVGIGLVVWCYFYYKEGRRAVQDKLILNESEVALVWRVGRMKGKSDVWIEKWLEDNAILVEPYREEDHAIRTQAPPAEGG